MKTTYEHVMSCFRKLSQTVLQMLMPIITLK